jgi:hypothetical protein
MAVYDSNKLFIPTTDSTSNILSSEVIGSKTDTANGTSIVSLDKRVAGTLVSKVITLNANAAPQSLNCFAVTGSVQVLRLYGQITTATTLANCTAAQFDLYDGAATTAITKNDGVLSGMAVGTTFFKGAVNTTTMAVLSNATGAFSDLSFYPFIVEKKTGQNTFIRFTYTTTDAPIAATLTIYAEYREIGTSSVLAAV